MKRIDTLKIPFRLSLVLVILITHLLVVAFGNRREPSQEVETSDHIRFDFFRGEFNVSGVPLVGETVELTFFVCPIQNAPNTTVRLILPSGIEALTKELTWSVDITRNEKVQFKTTIRVIEGGEWRIQAYVESLLGSGSRIKQSYYVYVVATDATGHVSKNSLIMTEKGTAIVAAEESPEKQVVDSMQQRSFSRLFSSEPTALSVESSPAAPGFITVTGLWEYQDETGIWNPIRFAKVELYDKELLLDELVATGQTDASGRYSFYVNNNDGFLEGGRDVYVKIHCESNEAKVTSNHGNILNIPYWSETDTHWDVPDGTVDMGTSYLPYDNYQALDYIIEESKWLKDRVSWTRPQVLVRWPSEDWPHSHGDSIDLPDKGIAAWDRTTVLHEYAHCVMWTAYKNSFPPGGGGSHAIWSEQIGDTNGQLVAGNSGFALIEGWAEFMEAAVDNNPENLSQLSPQGDLDGDGTPGTCTLVYDTQTGSWSIAYADIDDLRISNIEENEWWKGGDFDSSNNLGVIVEGAVASILWDIFDSTGLDDDELKIGIGAIWDIILNDNPISIIEFWDRWFDDTDGTPTVYDKVVEIMRIFDDHGSGPISRGHYWMRQQQNSSSGSLYNDPAVTSFAVLTMLNWGYDETDPFVAKGLGYILSKINANGSVYSIPGYYTYYTSIAILPLAATHNANYHDELTKMRNWLIGAQWDAGEGINTSHSYYGGFGYGSNIRPDLSNTQWALMGIKAADKELGLDATDTYNKCANYFLARCRNADGGSYYTPGGASIHTMTAASVWSYALCNRGSGAEALGGIQWLTNHYSLTNNDGWGWWSEYYYKVTLAKALTMTHKDMLGTHNWFNELSDKLIEEQYATGNWPDTGMPSSGEIGSAMSTCWAIMALQTRTMPPGGEFGMWATLESHADLHVYDPQGRHLGVNYETNTIEENIPGATFKILDPNGNEVTYDGNTPDEGFRQVVNLSMVVAGSYRFELVGTSDGPYHLIIGGTQDGNTVTSQTYDGEILAGQRLATNVTVTSMEGALTLIYEPLSVLPTLGVEPSELTVVVEPDTIGQATFTVKEVGGQETLHGVSMYCTDITGPDGYIDGSTVGFDVIGFDVPAGGQQIVNAYITVPADFKGPATGSIIVESIDGGTKAITLRLLTDITGPEVNIVFPELNIAVQDGITLTAEANDVSGVDAVYFYIREPNDGNGVPIEQEDLAGTFNPATGKWECAFDTTQLQDGYYVVLAKAVDTYGNVGWSQIVPFSIRNWAIIKLLPATPSSKAGRTMPVKFSIRIAQSVDPAMPFVYNEDLEIRVYKSTNPSVILQRSRFGTGSTDYRIDIAGEKYITNFKTLTTPATYVVEIWRPEKNFKVGSFTFKTVK